MEEEKLYRFMQKLFLIWKHSLTCFSCETGANIVFLPFCSIGIRHLCQSWILTNTSKTRLQCSAWVSSVYLRVVRCFCALFLLQSVHVKYLFANYWCKVFFGKSKQFCLIVCCCYCCKVHIMYKKVWLEAD